MKHARQVIRETVATLLAGVGPAVYQSRVYPMVTLPVISIFANAEEAESENDTIGAPRRYTRDLTLQIDVVVDAVTGSDDLMDDYTAEIEALMAADVTLGGVVTDTNLTRTTITLDGQSDTPIAKASLNYSVWYRTTGTDPENAL